MFSLLDLIKWPETRFNWAERCFVMLLLAAERSLISLCLLSQGPFVHVASLCAALLSKFMAALFGGTYVVRMAGISETVIVMMVQFPVVFDHCCVSVSMIAWDRMKDLGKKSLGKDNFTKDCSMFSLCLIGKKLKTLNELKGDASWLLYLFIFVWHTFHYIHMHFGECLLI